MIWFLFFPDEIATKTFLLKNNAREKYSVEANKFLTMTSKATEKRILATRAPLLHICSLHILSSDPLYDFITTGYQFHYSILFLRKEKRIFFLFLSSPFIVMKIYRGSFTLLARCVSIRFTAEKWVNSFCFLFHMCLCALHLESHFVGLGKYHGKLHF